MYYLKEKGFEQVNQYTLFNWEDLTEYSCDIGWYYVDHGDYFTLENVKDWN